MAAERQCKAAGWPFLPPPISTGPVCRSNFGVFDTRRYTQRSIKNVKLKTEGRSLSETQRISRISTQRQPPRVTAPSTRSHRTVTAPVQPASSSVPSHDLAFAAPVGAGGDPSRRRPPRRARLVRHVEHRRSPTRLCRHAQHPSGAGILVESPSCRSGVAPPEGDQVAHEVEHRARIGTLVRHVARDPGPPSAATS